MIVFLALLVCDFIHSILRTTDGRMSHTQSIDSDGITPVLFQMLVVMTPLEHWHFASGECTFHGASRRCPVSDVCNV
jgi:hypothetical protein